MVLLREDIRKLRLRLRCHGLSVREKRVIRLIIETIPQLGNMLLEYEDILDDDDDLALRQGIVRYIFRIIEFLLMPEPEHPRIYYHSRTINSFTDYECWNNFRTRKEDLPRLFTALRMPDNIILKNRARATGEEVMLMSLHRMSRNFSLEDLALNVYGKDNTHWSRAFNWFIWHCIRNFANLLVDNLAYWVPFFPHFAERIRAKLEAKSGVNFAPGNFRVFGFIDDKVVATTRPGGGPREPGEEAERFNPNLQRAFYNGWKKHHGIKFQTIELPNGLAADVFGPKSFRQSDVELLIQSDIDARLSEAQAGQPKVYAAYGDRIFLAMNNILRAHDNEPLSPREIAENDGMTKTRIGAEWGYGVTVELFPFVDHKKNLKLLQHPLHKMYFFVAILLRNAHMCLYDGLSASYFDCPAPELEDYFRVAM